MFLKAVLISLIAASVVMLVVWLLHFRLKNAALVDIAWAGNFAMIAIIYGFLGDGDLLRRVLMCVIVVIWSLRLTTHLYVRTVGQPEEGRYLELRRKWGDHVTVKFLLFYLFQGLTNVVLSLPFLIASLDQAPVGPLVFTGLILWGGALIGESIADRQLRQFKRSKSSGTAVCDVGLWRYSRHPNYFFEWLVWVSFFVFSLSSPYGLWGIISPGLILFFLLFLTGIPATEAQAVRSKGAAYKAYQQRTSAFIPWIPAKAEN